MSREDISARRVLWSSLAGACAGGLVFVLSLLNFTTDLGRSATKIRFAGNFFEVQAQAFLDGHLWVPDQSLAIEGFVMEDGHTYTYFGPFPALLRIPVLLVTKDFNGQLTVVSMFLAWVVFAVFVVRLCWLIRKLLRGESEVTRADAVLGALMVAGLTGGTVLTFDAALPWVYHEVYLWQSAFVVAAMYWMVRLVDEPSPAAFAWLTVCALGACLTRTTGGWGVCLGILAVAAWFRWGRDHADARRWAAYCLAAALVPLAIGVAVNMAKFGHPYMFPLENQVWTQLNEHRREALRVNGGTITGLQFFWPALITYFGPGIRFVGYFPWVTFPATPAEGHGAFIDQAYRTGSVTAFMPLFLVLAVLALPVLLRRTASMPEGRGIRSLRAPALAGFLMTGGVMAYGYFAYRYTSEFVPALVLGSLVTTWFWLAPVVEARGARRAGVLALVTLGVVYGMAANTAVGLSAAATQYQGEPLARFVSWQDAVSGGEGSRFAGLITHSQTLPPAGRTDQIHIRGNCEGLYVNTGETNQQWVTVEEQARLLEVRFPDRLVTGETLLFEIGSDQRVVLRTRRDGYAWLIFQNADDRATGAPFLVGPDEVMRIGLRPDPALGYTELSSTPGGFAAYIPYQEWDEDWQATIRDVVTPWAEAGRDPKTRVSVRPGTPLPTSLCPALAAHNGIDLE